jgi:acetyl esterase/lipase
MMMTAARCSSFFLFAALLGVTSLAAQTSKQNDLQAFVDKVNRPVVYKLAGMDAVRVRSNIPYKKDPTDDFLLMDLYTPPASHGLLPVVIFIHGGVRSDITFRAKDWGFYQSWGRLAAASGLAAITFNHRVRFPDPNLEQGAADVTDLVSFVRAHAHNWGLDPDRICLAAFSAGGPMLSAFLRDRLSYVRAVVAFYAFLDIQQSSLHKPYFSEQQLREFSPLYQLTRNTNGLPPIFVARAGKDQVPDLEPGLDRFVTAAIAQNVSLEFWNHPDGVHGFDSLNDDERSREIVRAALQFMKTYLGME